MKVRLTKFIEALVRAVSDDITRPALQHIAMVKPQGRSKKRYMVATDGQVLLVAPAEVIEPPEGNDERLLPGSFLRRFLKLTTKKLRGLDTEATFEVQHREKEGAPLLYLANACGTGMSEWGHDLLPFPSVHLVWPTTAPDTVPVQFSRKTLKQLLDAMGDVKVGRKDEYVYLTLWVPTLKEGQQAASGATVLRIHASEGGDTEELTGLLMPCLPSSDPKFPDPFRVVTP